MWERRYSPRWIKNRGRAALGIHAFRSTRTSLYIVQPLPQELLESRPRRPLLQWFAVLVGAAILAAMDLKFGIATRRIAPTRNPMVGAAL